MTIFRTAANGADDHPARLASTLFGCSSLLAVLIGCWVARAGGASDVTWLSNIVAWLVGGICAAGLSRLNFAALRWWIVPTLAGLACTLLAPGLSGVHRWLRLGALRLNGAEFFLAASLVSLAAPGLKATRRLLFVFATLGLLVLQPDASQAIAFAGGAIVITCLSPIERIRRALVAMGIAATAAVAMFRPDPLLPAPDVEGIIKLAAAFSPALAATAVVALAASVSAPLLVRSPAAPVRRAALGLSTYLALGALASVPGAFPTPLIGMGVSPILGAWLGFGALMSLAKSQRLVSRRQA